MLQSKTLILSTLISLGAALSFAAHPLSAQTASSITPNGQEQAGEQGIANDFDNDVRQGRDELGKDPEARRNQNDVVDGEDGQAGEGDGQNNQEGVDEYGDIQQSENNQGVNEDSKDINNSGIDEVGDSNNLDEQSQEIINEHQVQEDGEVDIQDNSENTSSQENTPTGSDTEQNHSEGQNSNQ